jgi:hypothetical protein
MKKYIFLDIDGVLATSKEFNMNTQKFWEKNEWAKNLKVPYKWNESAVKIFNEILETTNAEIVLSSDWRKHWNLEELDIIFKENGVVKSPKSTTIKYRETFDHDFRNRASQIESYIRTNNFIDENEQPTCLWIVLDDLPIKQFFPEHLKDRIFQTNDREGIKISGMKEKIIKKLTE